VLPQPLIVVDEVEPGKEGRELSSLKKKGGVPGMLRVAARLEECLIHKYTTPVEHGRNVRSDLPEQEIKDDDPLERAFPEGQSCRVSLHHPDGEPPRRRGLSGDPEALP